MKRTTTFIAAATFFLGSVTVWAHHAAEGIIADDIYEMIDDNLAGTPHLALDLTTMGSGADTLAAISITMPEEDVDEVLGIIADALQGQGTQQISPLEVRIFPPDEDDLVTIVVIENIGQGQSQVAEPAM